MDSASLAGLAAFFETFPDVLFAVKDANLRYVAANAAMLTFCGVRAGEFLGQGSSSFFPSAARHRYEGADRDVLQTGSRAMEVLDLTAPHNGQPAWVVIGRWPLRAGKRGKPNGVVVIGRLLDASKRRDGARRRVAIAADHIQNSSGENLSVASLAQALNVSHVQLDRDFAEVFGVSPREHHVHARIMSARRLLKLGHSVQSVAIAAGYQDQSAFARRFKAVTGLTPRAYRNEIRKSRQ